MGSDWWNHSYYYCDIICNTFPCMNDEKLVKRQSLINPYGFMLITFSALKIDLSTPALYVSSHVISDKNYRGFSSNGGLIYAK